MSKKQERLRSELLSEDRITNLLGFLTYIYIKPRRIEHLQGQEPFSSDPYFKTTDKTLPIIYQSMLL
mgnify:CR=1 FL=1